MKDSKCLTCKYYVPHYIQSGTRYYPIDGHCTHHDIYSLRGKKRGVPQEDCDRWESDEEKKAELKKDIVQVLRDIETHLKYIANILINDQE